MRASSRATEAAGLPFFWGATSAERSSSYPCDALASPGSCLAVRAVSCAADPDGVFGWLCQLRRAPYSYDLLDNFGRRSPRALRADLLDLHDGQTFMTIFTLVGHVQGRSITLALKPGLPTAVFGPLVCTYEVRPDTAGSRLLCALQVPLVGAIAPHLRRRLLCWGDLVMMRKQLLTLAALSRS